MNNQSRSRDVDPDYEQMRQNINDGQRLPYRQYVYQRTKEYILNIATDEEVDAIQKAIDKRLLSPY